jgi:hypothetical protein
MARVVSEKLWTSEKVRNIKPEEWQPEYSWLLPIATADGTFECAPRLVWAQAYSCNRAKWNVDDVGLLLDELVRVGLLQRATDETGKVWGRWVGSEKFLPTKERCKTNRYKTGRGDLFEISDGAAPAQRQESDGAATAQRPLGVGVVGGFGGGEGKGVDLVCGQGSANEQEQVKSVCSSPSPTAQATATATAEPPNPDDFSNRLDYSVACRKAGVLPQPRRLPSERRDLATERFEKQRAAEEEASMLRNFGVVPDGQGRWKKPDGK